MIGEAEHESDHDHEHEHDHGHDHDLAKNTRSARLVTRYRRPETLVGSSSIDMDCLYMEVAAEVKRIMHRYGVHSTTIQPEFVVGQAVAVATTKTDNANDSSGHQHRSEDGCGESIFSRVAILPESLDSRDIDSSAATIGPCLLACRDTQCQPSACCPAESPIKVIPGSESLGQNKK
ncbi:hypothetical protein FB639_006236 [Coemansia asiatica]|nr:hypothetical protein FB639_006236 [Coemansia asiatica]